MTWFNDLMGKAAIPTEGSTAGKPVTPVAPFPELPPSQVRDLRFDGRLRQIIATQISPTIAAYLQIAVPTIALNQFGPDDYWPDERLCIGSTIPTAAGGQITQGQIRNPKNSGILVVLEAVIISQATLANTVAWAFIGAPGSADLGTIAQSAYRDTRAGFTPTGGPGTRAVLSQANAAAAAGVGTQFDTQNLPTGPSIVRPMNYTFQPDTGLSWFTATQGAQQTFVTWLWRERPIVTGS